MFRWIRILAITTGFLSLISCSAQDAPLTATERETLHRLTSWPQDSTVEDVRQYLPELEFEELDYPPVKGALKGRVTVFDVDFEGNFNFGVENFAGAAYGAEQLEEVEARALYSRLRSGLKELYGEYEEETSRGSPFTGRSAKWSLPDDRLVTANLALVPENDEGRIVFFTMYHNQGVIPYAPSDILFGSLWAVCGKAYRGKVVSTDAADADFAGKSLVMHVRDCEANTLRVPFHVGEDRSRTWIVSRTETGLRLKHDHRHEDGSEDVVTQYGGETLDRGSAQRQEFPADPYSKDMFEREGLSASVDNVWAMEFHPGELFAYELKRPGRFFRVEFDLKTPVNTPPAAWGASTVIEQVFAGEHVYFAGDNNRRRVERKANLPDPAGVFGKATLDLALRCPDGGCDRWDRKGYIGLVRDSASSPDADPDDHGEVTELVRFMTPYGVAGRWSVDVTRMLPLLEGRRKMRAFIDTWVGPGHEQGAGWLVDATLRYEPAATSPPAEIIALWDAEEVGYGDPANPPEVQLPARTVAIPRGASRVELRVIVTGHGQGNADNCSEFCSREHAFHVDETAFTRRVWRDDCERNPLDNQKGNWRYARAGWCPGSTVEPWIVDVTEAAMAGRSVSIRYAPEDYVNTCRPDSPECTGCTLDTGCEYDGGRHTPPIYLMSAALVIYR